MSDRAGLRPHARSLAVVAMLVALGILAALGVRSSLRSRRRAFARNVHGQATGRRSEPFDSGELTTLAMNEHQIKTSLSAAAGWADLLAGDEIELDSDVRTHAAQRVSVIINRAIASINRDIALLADSRHLAEGGQSRSDTGLLLPLSLRAFEAAAGKAFALDARRGLIVDCPPGIYRQIIDQLLENAVKYSPPGRSIRVTTRHEGAMVVTSVIDEGFGLPDGVDIFAPYVRAAPPDAPDGSGLGLHIVRTLVERHGGTVRAHRNAHAGSTFDVRLPGVSSSTSAR